MVERLRQDFMVNQELDQVLADFNRVRMAADRVLHQLPGVNKLLSSGVRAFCELVSDFRELDPLLAAVGHKPKILLEDILGGEQVPIVVKGFEPLHKRAGVALNLPLVGEINGEREGDYAPGENERKFDVELGHRQGDSGEKDFETTRLPRRN